MHRKRTVMENVAYVPRLIMFPLMWFTTILFLYLVWPFAFLLGMTNITELKEVSADLYVETKKMMWYVVTNQWGDLP